MLDVGAEDIAAGIVAVVDVASVETKLAAIFEPGLVRRLAPQSGFDDHSRGDLAAPASCAALDWPCTADV